MLFLERKKESGFHYRCEDVFGIINIESSTKLTGDLLDGITWQVIKSNLSAATVQGTVKHDDGVVTYKLERESQWSDDDEEACDDTHTSTSKQENESPQAKSSKKRGTSWLQKFAVLALKPLQNLVRKLEKITDA